MQLSLKRYLSSLKCQSCTAVAHHVYPDRRVERYRDAMADGKNFSPTDAPVSAVAEVGSGVLSVTASGRSAS